MDLFTTCSSPSLFTAVNPCIATAHSEPYHHDHSCHHGNHTPDSKEIDLQVTFHYHILHFCFFKWPRVPDPVDPSNFLRFRLWDPIRDVSIIREERCGAITPHHRREEPVLAMASMASDFGVGRVCLAAAVVPSQGAHLG